MPMRRWAMGIGAGTLVALAYTHQQIVLIEARYAMERRLAMRADRLDQHHILLYNVLTLQAPRLLEQRLARRDVTLVSPRRIAWMAPSSVPAIPAAELRGAPGLLARGRQVMASLVTPHATAEAEPAP
ncbi:MAG: hypothetical protein HY600_04955 [Candidatus Omnitrophica bacterium]|nr:hypothetical protein [Candidatus Omnitrophota bacterium]